MHIGTVRYRTSLVFVALKGRKVYIRTTILFVFDLTSVDVFVAMGIEKPPVPPASGGSYGRVLPAGVRRMKNFGESMFSWKRLMTGLYIAAVGPGNSMASRPQDWRLLVRGVVEARSGNRMDQRHIAGTYGSGS